MKTRNTKSFKIKALLLVVLAIFVFQHKIYATDNIDIHGKWAANIYISLPDGCVLNDSTLNAYGIIPCLGSNLYFNENGKGFLDFPAKDVIIEFKWHLSNDTISILYSDTLVQYKIDNNDSRKLYLRLLSKETKAFHFSYVAYSMNLSPSRFVLDNSIKKELEDSVRETINDIKEKRRVDEIIIGYEKDKEYHYTYLYDSKAKSENELFSNIQNWKNGSKYILYILYDEKMHSLQKIRNYVFRDDKFMSERISYETCENFPITRDVKKE